VTASTDAREDYLALRESITSVQLATLSSNLNPEASYAPCVWFEGSFFLYLSGLSSHSANLATNSQISLLLIDENADTANAFARKRASLHGSAQIVERDSAAFANVMQAFHERFGKVMQIIEPLPDFRMFRVVATAGSFVRGFGQAYELGGDGLDQLRPVDPRR